jgi:transcriptional regulatory protein LevR
MRDKEMILVDESNESQKVQTLKEILIIMGNFKLFYVSNIPHVSISGIISYVLHTPYPAEIRVKASK